MATLTLTVDDTIVPRLRSAYGVTTNAQLKTAIIQQIRSHVRSYEVTETVKTEQAKVEAAQTAQAQAVASADTKADSEIALT